MLLPQHVGSASLVFNQPVQFMDMCTSSDILCGRNRTAFNHPGNIRLRVLVNSFLPKYLASPNRSARSKVITAIFHEISSSGGRFLKNQSPGTAYLELSIEETREKIGHALRDAKAAAKADAKKRAASEEASGYGTLSGLVKKQRKKRKGAIYSVQPSIGSSQVLNTPSRNKKEMRVSTRLSLTLGDDSLCDILSALAQEDEKRLKDPMVVPLKSRGSHVAPKDSVLQPQEVMSLFENPLLFTGTIETFSMDQQFSCEDDRGACCDKENLTSLLRRNTLLDFDPLEDFETLEEL